MPEVIHNSSGSVRMRAWIGALGRTERLVTPRGIVTCMAQGGAAAAQPAERQEGATAAHPH